MEKQITMRELAALLINIVDENSDLYEACNAILYSFYDKDIDIITNVEEQEYFLKEFLSSKTIKELREEDFSWHYKLKGFMQFYMIFRILRDSTNFSLKDKKLIGSTDFNVLTKLW